MKYYIIEKTYYGKGSGESISLINLKAKTIEEAEKEFLSFAEFQEEHSDDFEKIDKFFYKFDKCGDDWDSPTSLTYQLTTNYEIIKIKKLEIEKIEKEIEELEGE